MSPSTIIELLEQLQKGRIQPTSVDLLFIQLLNDSNDKNTSRLLQGNHQFMEVRNMLLEALRERGGEDSRSTNVLMSFRSLVSAEEAGNRNEAIKSAKSLLSQIDRVKYPLTSGFASLKIGTALLAAMSQTGRGAQVGILRESIACLLQALKDFGEEDPDLRCLAHYNLALAYNALWEANDDWDDVEPESKDAALQHGREAIDLMDKGVKAGDRLALTRVLITLTMSGGEQAERDKGNRAFVVKLVKGFLASPAAKSADHKVRDHFQKFLAAVGKSQ
jgi:hypothetical protein